jgi:hypothetical protein
MAAIMFDKSAFQAIKAEDHGRWMFRFTDVIAPILLTEILADLSKSFGNQQDSARASGFVKALANKFNGSGGTVNVEWRLPCAGSLNGRQEPPMNGQILAADFDDVIGPDGERSILLGPSDGNRNILRWARAAFHADEHEFAQRFRKLAQAFEIENLIGRLKGKVQMVDGFVKLAGAVDAILSDPSMQRVLLDWMVDQLRPQGGVLRIRTETVNRWHAAKRPLLKDFAPYAHHCARCLLLLIVGHNVLSKRATNRLDVEYLLYLPFCHVFVSNDPLHEQLAPIVMRPDQRTVRSDVLLADPEGVAKAADALVDFSSDRPFG